ncbi:uncharacterized protein TRIVIDRAFT_67348 [Trichoderma virens Gv29-8]|uniref:SNF2 N-terminal domain-containing protein n=1 Tax=Hypocrea virens (strain Gv29-8 / FGSC 10586) TaxID=413071 RepID=G9N5U9_HYPVG|nr:uncharacterized protein TRIVIDRAFT_67348 [Trichoderma virens Gv29-8]EHK18140.1 hypothetical protein TRIVIDRAFT_67348 [Trichoderma virens Gv29-8]UKZ53988.1 hypothetical protein TrVGV298_007792 [Trichoderma virens]
MSLLSKRSQSPNQALDEQSPSKRSKQEEKVDLIGGPDTNKPLLITAGWKLATGWMEEWSIGEPIPAALIPPNYVPSLQFRAQIPTTVPEGLMKEAVDNWLSSECKTRPKFSHLLFSESLQINLRFLAGYLGFNTSREFHVFVDFEVPKTIKQFIRLQYSRNELCNANTMSILPQASESLDESDSQQILITKGCPAELVTEGSSVRLQDIDLVLSILSAAYKLIKENPGRFCQRYPSESNQYTWDIHHEDWMRAHAVTVYTITRQIEMAEAFKTPIPGDEKWLCRNDKKNLLSEYNTTTSMDFIQELDILDCEHDTARMNMTSQLAETDVTDALNTGRRYQSENADERRPITEDNTCTLAESITDAVCAALDAISPGVVMGNEIYSPDIPLTMRQPQITKNEVDALQVMLKRQACRAQFREPSPTAESTANTHPDALQEKGSGKSSATRFRALVKMRAQLGDSLPPNQDLESICRHRRIDMNTLAVNPHNPSTVAKAPQIPDANRLAELLAGPLRNAMLLSEGGTDKPFVTLLTLKFLIEERAHQFKNDDLIVEEDDRIFKPSIIFVPSAVLDHVLAEVTHCWSGVVDIWLLHKARNNCMDPDRKVNTIEKTEELQKHIDHWATEHHDPATGRVLLLTSYETWLEFTSVSKADRPLTKNEKMDENEAVQCHSSLNVDHNHSQSGIQQGAKAPANQEPLALKNAMWNVVILDECQVIQNKATAYNQLVMQLDRDALLLVSAYPLAAIRDLYVYLQLMWDSAWPFSYSFELEPTLRETLHDSGTYGALLSIGKTDKDILLNVVTGGNTVTERLNWRQRQRYDEYLEFVLGGYGPAYLLHPELFKGPGFSARYVTDSLVAVVRTILEMVSVRRGLLTPMKLPSGEVTCLGKDIGGLAVRTVELIPTASVLQKIQDHILTVEDYLRDANDPEANTEGCALNNTLHCRLSMMSTDVKNVALMTPTRRLLKRLSRLQQGANRLISERPAEDDDEVDVLDTTGGLHWLFYNTRDSQSYGFPTDKMNQVRYAVWDSPKYCHVLLRAFEAQQLGEKLLVLANNPWTCRIMNALLVACGIKSLHYYATVAHAISRLWRIGQRNDVSWEILIARHSFDSFMETKMLDRYAGIIEVTGRINDAITGEARKICAFEIMRQQLGQECSRYPRVGVPWDQLDEDKMRQEGYFYSALAEFFFKNPTKAYLVRPDNVCEIARAWKFGMKITTAMVEHPIPLKDGEGLAIRNFTGLMRPCVRKQESREEKRPRFLP